MPTHSPRAAGLLLALALVGAPRVTPDYEALQVMNETLGGLFSSRINLNLREDKGFTYGARSSFDFRRQPGPFSAQVSVQTAVTVPANGAGTSIVAFSVSSVSSGASAATTSPLFT